MVLNLKLYCLLNPRRHTVLWAYIGLLTRDQERSLINGLKYMIQLNTPEVTVQSMLY